MIEIDGSVGGGSVLRVALPLAIGLNKEIIIDKIRYNRPKPGLRNQHLIGVNALAKLANYTIKGNKIGSNRIELSPQSTRSVQTSINLQIDTAASVSLIFQAISNYCIAAKTKATVSFNGGGTHTQWSPNFDYLRYCFVPMLNSIGIPSHIYVDRFGFYPKGGAKGSFKVDGTNGITAFNISQPSKLLKIEMYGLASEKLKHGNVVERMFKGLNLSKSQLETNSHYVQTMDAGASLTAVINYANGLRFGIGLLGQKGWKSEDIGKKITELITTFPDYQNNYWVDEYMADQLLLPLAFAPSGSKYAFLVKTDHVRVNLQIIEKILGKVFSIEEINDVFIVKRV